MDFKNYLDSRILFSIPIYFRSQKDHTEYFQQKKRKYLQHQRNLYKRLGGDFPKGEKTRLKFNFDMYNSYMWKYNETIGYIEIRVKLHYLYFFTYLIECDRFQPIMNKRFSLDRYFPDFSIDMNNISNEQIILEVHRIFDKINNHSGRMRNRHIDPTLFDAISSQLDFHRFIISSESSYD